MLSQDGVGGDKCVSTDVVRMIYKASHWWEVCQDEFEEGEQAENLAQD